MTTKIIALCVLLVCSVQAKTTHLNGDHLLEANVGSLIDDATKLFDQVFEKVQESVKSAIETITLTFNEVKTYAEEIANQASFKFQEQFKVYINQLTKVKDEAKAVGVDITECLKDEGTFLEVPQAFAKSITTCVTDKIDEAKNIYNSSVNAITDNIEEVKKDKDELKQCGSGLTSAACILRVIGKMGVQLANIPVKITTESAESLKLLATLKPYIEKCVADTSTQSAVDAQKLIENIVTCSNDKIHKK